jgi:dCMP deaminase
VKSGEDKMEAKKLNKYDKAYLRIATEWALCHY